MESVWSIKQRFCLSGGSSFLEREGIMFQVQARFRRMDCRRGVTMIELLVVIAIILIIMAILFPLIFRTMEAVREARTALEIKQLDQACETFKMTFGRYPPGRIMLCETMEGYRQAIIEHRCQTWYQERQPDRDALAWLAMDSMEYLKSIFPGIDLNAGHDWNGDGVIDDRQYFLQGDDCLTFFLGGMRYGLGAVDPHGSNRTGGLGFNTDKTNPTKRTTSERLGPFFEFDSSRISYETRTNLTVWNGNFPGDDPDEFLVEPDWSVGSSTGLYPRAGESSLRFFPHYRDQWNRPYYYFAARNGVVDNYVYLYSPFCYRLGLTTTNVANYHYYLADCSMDLSGDVKPPRKLTLPKWPGPRSDSISGTSSTIWLFFVPYIQTYQENIGVTYHNPRRFQIISAGADRDFGSGGYLDLSNPELSRFENYKFIPQENIPRPEEKKANYDNITNINFQRVVPR
jgi:prepilin-type N-terminal cleavage/methylation domain-containing protein